MSQDINKIIKSIIPKDEILSAFEKGNEERMEELMYEVADHESLFQSYIELNLPEVLYKICEESMRYLLETQNKELVLYLFTLVTENIEYTESEPIPENLFEQFNK